MIKDAEALKRRREFIKLSFDTRSIKSTTAVRHIARELFISERTVYRDLRKAREEGLELQANPC